MKSDGISISETWDQINMVLSYNNNISFMYIYHDFIELFQEIDYAVPVNATDLVKSRFQISFKSVSNQFKT